MTRRKALITGFGAFEKVERNPSGELALRLHGTHDPQGLVEWVGIELPVSFRRAPGELRRAIETHRPDLVLATGVHKEDGFRVERQARAALRPGRADVDGVRAEELEGGPVGTDLSSTFDVERLVSALSEGPVAGFASSDAGGYVCECVYRAALETDVPAVFLHVPPLELQDIETQLRAIVPFMDELLAQLP